MHSNVSNYRRRVITHRFTAPNAHPKLTRTVSAGNYYDRVGSFGNAVFSPVTFLYFMILAYSVLIAVAESGKNVVLLLVSDESNSSSYRPIDDAFN